MLSVNVCLRKHTGINLLKTEVHLNLQTYDVHSQPHSEHSSCPLQGQLMLSGKYSFWTDEIVRSINALCGQSMQLMLRVVITGLLIVKMSE